MRLLVDFLGKQAFRGSKKGMTSTRAFPTHPLLSPQTADFERLTAAKKVKDDRRSKRSRTTLSPWLMTGSCSMLMA